MPSVLVQLDEITFKALNRVAPAAKRKRTEFIRNAVKEAIRRQEFARMRKAYQGLPDDPITAGDWSNWEDFQS